MNCIGILGGTFDPFHYGHLSIAKAAMKEYRLDRIILLPAKVQPFKVGRQITNEQYRVEMLNLVAAENDNFIVSTIETSAETISYTYKTMMKLQEIYKDDKLFFIMGTDSFLELDTWYMGTELLMNFSFIVGVRPGYKSTQVNRKAEEYKKKYNADIGFLHNDILEISSTEIKSKIKAGKCIDDLVPHQIERYIEKHGLYK